MSAATTATLRATLMGALPAAVEAAVLDYQDLVTSPTPASDKDRAARQGAAKATLAHIESLFRMATGLLPTGEPTAAETAASEAAALLARARAALGPDDGLDLEDEEEAADDPDDGP